MFYTYILQSLTNKKYYVGHTDDLSRRLEEHNSGKSKYTRTGAPWKLVYFEKNDSRSLAVKRELEIKKRKSKRFIENLIRSAA